MTKKLIIVSSRLPVSVRRVDGVITIERSTGGLATALGSLTPSQSHLWIGWPGIASDDLSEAERSHITRELLAIHCKPVFLTQHQIDTFYAGYSNAMLWPIFHYFPERALFRKEFWDGYQEVNALFANTIIASSNKTDQLWVHDYQLMLVPRYIRAAYPHASIGFFLHIPFPSFELFRQIPERSELLQGLLGADVIGFHTYDYARHFLSSCQRIAGLDHYLNKLHIDDRSVLVDAFPISIDPHAFAPDSKSSPRRRSSRKVVLSIDRADYTKGIPERLDAFEEFLRRYPEHHHNVRLQMIAVPSRNEIESYQLLRETIEQKVSHINGEFATRRWTPISYRYQALPFEEVRSLYQNADVMLVTPLRDGMNLVAKEFVASKQGSGVLILSDMTGAASELTDSLLVNPRDISRVADAIHRALIMPEDEQKRRLEKMQTRILRYDVTKWATDFVRSLKIVASPRHANDKLLTPRKSNSITSAYHKHTPRLILLDYDGTLRSFVDSPDEQYSKPDDALLDILQRLTSDRLNDVYIISGRRKSTLENYFRHIPRINLIAEHGAWLFENGSWHASSRVDITWKQSVRDCMNEYVDNTPDSILEEKEFSLVWHYRRVDPELAYVRKEDLKTQLGHIIDQPNIIVHEGQKIIEVKPAEMNKGSIVQTLLRRKDYEFVLVAGDDYTDEDMFTSLPSTSVSINVGHRETHARHQVANVATMIKLLSDITRTY